MGGAVLGGTVLEGRRYSKGGGIVRKAVLGGRRYGGGGIGRGSIGRDSIGGEAVLGGAVLGGALLGGRRYWEGGVSGGTRTVVCTLNSGGFMVSESDQSFIEPDHSMICPLLSPLGRIRVRKQLKN